MQNGFTSPDGFVWVSTPDTLAPRPRVPIASSYTVKNLYTPQNFDDFLLAWLPTFPAHVSRLRPIHPNWIGVDGPAVMGPAIAPISWMPTLLGFLNAPRLHQTFPPYKADPLSGPSMTAAVEMAWDPRPKAPLVLRPKFAATQFAYGASLTVSLGTLTCSALDDIDLTTPAMLTQALSVPTMLNPALTVPTILDERLC